MPTTDVVFSHFNSQGLGPKEEIVKMEMKKHGVLHGGFCETYFYKNGGISDKDWVWNTGPEVQPGLDHNRASRGLGTLTRRGAKSATVHVSDQLMVSRVEMHRRQLPVYVFEVHFEKSTDTAGHKKMWAKIRELVREYEDLGHVVLMGDFNAHTKANGDKTADAAGRRFLKQVGKMGLHVVYNM